MLKNQQPRLYFAYGSNLNLEQMRVRCPKHQVIGPARLPGYRLGFYGYSMNWDGAVATIIAEAGAEVWGVLYQLNIGDWGQLDRFENVKDDGTGDYFHMPVEVINQQGELQEATAYVKATLGTTVCPSTEYLQTILQGMESHQLPETYVAGLRSLETKPAGYAVPRRKNLDGPVGNACGDCG